MRRALIRGIGIAALVLAGAFGWLSWRRGNELERQLGESRRELAGVRAGARQQAAELAAARERAAAVGRKAEEASARAEQESAKAEEAAAARLRADEQRRLAEEEKERAREQMLRSREELESLRARREKELDRMQEALARIAQTRRTPAGMVVELGSQSFRFDFDRATLRPENRELLSRVAGVLLASTGYRLSVHGHTDDVGSEAYNQDLSERRAKSVAEYLESAGIDADLINVKGFGKSSPRAQGTTRDAREKNRRVEIAIVDSIVHYREVLPGR